MIRELIGAGSTVDALLRGLDTSAVRSREIAHRVANASNDAASFIHALESAESQVDVETEMVSLASEQIRYEAMTEILGKLYSQLRASARGS